MNLHVYFWFKGEERGFKQIINFHILGKILFCQFSPRINYINVNLIKHSPRNMIELPGNIANKPATMAKLAALFITIN